VPIRARRRSLAALAAASVTGAAVALVALVGCGDDRVRNEAMLFLDRYERIDQEQPVDVRRPLVEELRDLSLVTPDVVHARDACVDAHMMLLEAEERHAAAREELMRATEGGDHPLEVDAAARIEAAIEESNAAIERSPALFERCYREVRSLEGRFHRRRAAER
jgi:hypothetical protein